MAREASVVYTSRNFPRIIIAMYIANIASASTSCVSRAAVAGNYASNPSLRSLARRAGGGASAAALGFASMSVPFGRLVPAPAIGRAWGMVAAISSFRPTVAAVAPSTVRMMSGWKGGSSSSRGLGRTGGANKRSTPEGGWKGRDADSDQRAGGWGSPKGDSGGWGDGRGDTGSWGDDDGGRGPPEARALQGRGEGRGGSGARGGRGGSGARERGGGYREGASFRGGRGGRGGRVGGMRPDRENETREEMFERQREYQAVQAERKSWMEEQAQEFPHTTIYVSSYYYICTSMYVSSHYYICVRRRNSFPTLITSYYCVLALLYIYYYICVLILLYMCPQAQEFPNADYLHGVSPVLAGPTSFFPLVVFFSPLDIHC